MRAGKIDEVGKKEEKEILGFILNAFFTETYKFLSVHQAAEK